MKNLKFIWFARIAILAFCLCLLGLVGRNCLVLQANQTGLALPFKPIPDDSMQLLARAGLLNLELQKEQLDLDELVDVSKLATGSDPLDFRPFLLRGLSAQKMKRYDLSIALLEASRTRQPRDFTTRFLLMQSYIATGRYGEGIREILSGSRLGAGQGDRLMQALAVMSQDTSVRSELVAAFAERADWRRQFINDQSAVLAAPKLVLEVASNPKATERDKLAAVTALANNGQLGLAYGLWVSTAKRNLIKAGEFPTDGGFDGWAQDSVFGWKMLESGEAVGEIVADDSSGKGKVLEVEYFGGGATTIVEQPLLLRPGKHTLTISGNHVEGQEGGGEFRWTISCQKAAKPIGVLRIGSASLGKFSGQGSFAVPQSNCQTQYLRLTVIPGELDRSMRSRFNFAGIN
jgi:hypothetical protein